MRSNVRRTSEYGAAAALSSSGFEWYNVRIAIGNQPITGNAEMTPQQFIAKWQRVTLSERSACHEHFLDLCALLGQPTPAAPDPEGTWYTFENLERAAK